jgi:hypothetical protein
MNGMRKSGYRAGVGLAVACLALTTLVGKTAAGQQGGRGGGPPAAGDDAARALSGAIDIHVHSLPDNVPRSVDVFEAATLANAEGMRGLILKNHYDETAGLVYLVRKQFPNLEVYGGIDLNLTVGGMNVAAVEHMTQMTGGWGRFVWMSTFDAENQVRYSKESRPFVSVSKNGALLPETLAVIASIAKHQLVLASGHTSAEEGLMLFREGRRAGVQHMVMTHAMNAPILATVAQMQAATKEGAFIEFSSGSLTAPDSAAKMDTFADAIRKVGPQFCILSTDLGQKNNPLPTDGLAAAVAAMRSRGFTERETDMMTRDNPARLLGLSVLPRKD